MEIHGWQRGLIRTGYNRHTLREMQWPLLNKLSRAYHGAVVLVFFYGVTASFRRCGRVAELVKKGILRLFRPGPRNRLMSQPSLRAMQPGYIQRSRVPRGHHSSQ